MSHESQYRKFSKEFRESALRRLALTPNVSELCRELGISRQLLYLWRDTRQREQQKQAQDAGQRLRQENTRLQKALLKKTLEVDFLKAACEKVEALRPGVTGSGAMASGKLSGN
jgi:transposase-like protein